MSISPHPRELEPIKVWKLLSEKRMLIQDRLHSVAFHQMTKSDGAPIRSIAPSTAETVAVAMDATMRICSMGSRWKPQFELHGDQITPRAISRPGSREGSVRCHPPLPAGQQPAAFLAAWRGYPALLRGLGSVRWAADSIHFSTLNTHYGNHGQTAPNKHTHTHCTPLVLRQVALQ